MKDSKYISIYGLFEPELKLYPLYLIQQIPQKRETPQLLPSKRRRFAMWSDIINDVVYPHIAAYHKVADEYLYYL